MAPTESFGTDALGFGGSGWQLLIRGSKVKDLAEAETKTKGYSDVRSACITAEVDTIRARPSHGENLLLECFTLPN